MEDLEGEVCTNRLAEGAEVHCCWKGSNDKYTGNEKTRW